MARIAGNGAGPGKWLGKTAVLWALHDAPGVPARLVSTLIAVAAYADSDGRGAYPSGATIAAITRKSESQAKRDIAELEKLGLLRPGDERIVKDIRPDRRPKIYDLPLDISRGASGRTPVAESRGASERPPPTGPRGASGYRTGRIQLQNGGRPDAPEEFLKNSGIARDGASADGARTNAPGNPSAACCPYCRSIIDLEHIGGGREELGDEGYSNLVRIALTGELACDNDECQKASYRCIRCQADLADDVNYMCRACRMERAS